MTYQLPDQVASETPSALSSGLRESLMASLALSVDDDDTNFIDVVDYLLAPDKDGCVSDRVIQKYLTLNPQAKEHLVEMLKQLATANVDEHRFADAVEPQASSASQDISSGGNLRAEKDTKLRTTPRIGFVQVVGATPKAFQLLQMSNRPVEGVSILSSVPPPCLDDSDWDDLSTVGPKFNELHLKAVVGSSGDTDSTASSGCKKKRRKRKKNKGKRTGEGEIDFEMELEESEETDVYREMYRIDETLELFKKPLELPAEALAQPDPNLSQQQQEQLYNQQRFCMQMYLSSKHLAAQMQQQNLQKQDVLHSTSDSGTEAVTPSEKAVAESSSSAIPTTTTTTTSNDATLKADALFDKEFKFKSVGQHDTKVATWDELKCLVSEVFPYDSELKKAFESKSQNSFELWKFVVKYGKMYKDFVSEVLEMVNELKKGLHEAMDMHREKTSEILESHKKEMCSVVEKARLAEGKIDLLEKELDKYQQVLDDQKVKIFGQDEEIEKLRKEQVIKDKKIKDFDNVKKSLVVEKNKAKGDVKKLAEDLREMKVELDKERKSNETLRNKVRREAERTEDLEYKLRELENQHYDDQIELENVQERNSVLTYKVDDLLREIAFLKEQLAKQEAQARQQQPAAATAVVHSSDEVQQLSDSPPAEDMGSCSSFGVFTEASALSSESSSSSSSSFGSKTPFSGLSSAVESPKVCSPVPVAATVSHVYCDPLGNELHSLLSPKTGYQRDTHSLLLPETGYQRDTGTLLAPDLCENMLDGPETMRPCGDFSRTIRKGCTGGQGQPVSQTLPDVAEKSMFFSDYGNYPANVNNASPGYNPWGPSSFGGLASQQLLGSSSSSGSSTLFNGPALSLGGLPNGLIGYPPPPGFELNNNSNKSKSDASSGSNSHLGPTAAMLSSSSSVGGCTQSVVMNGCLGRDLSDALIGNGLAPASGRAVGSGSSGGAGPIGGRRLPVRRSLDFSDLGTSFYP